MSRLKRLIKKAENTVELIAKANWCVRVESYSGYSGYENSQDMKPTEYDDEAVDLAEEDFEKSKAVLLEVMQESCPHLVDIKFDLDTDDASSYFHGIFSEEPDEEEKARFLDEITGQYSDGWGEGLEQHAFKTEEEDEEYEVEDRETGEYYTEQGNIEHEYFVVLWPDDFKIEFI